MKRTLMQVYVKGSVEAVELYQKAFDAKLGITGKSDDGAYMHAELDVDGQIVAVSEASDQTIGNQMQFCLHFHLHEKDKVAKAYEVLQKDAMKVWPPDRCDWSPYVTGVIDKFGINWCLFIS